MSPEASHNSTWIFPKFVTPGGGSLSKSTILKQGVGGLSLGEVLPAASSRPVDGGWSFLKVSKYVSDG